MDGSHHDWFEGRRGEAVLMVMIDDATGRIYTRFFEEETLAAAFDIFQRYATRYGVPRALYVDRAGIYRSDREPTTAEMSASFGTIGPFAGSAGSTAFCNGLRRTTSSLSRPYWFTSNSMAKCGCSSVNGN
jgi:hypothetical protein